MCYNAYMKQRNTYLQKLIGGQDPELVKVLTGVRRSGKSTLLKMMRRHCLDSGVPEQDILVINYEKQEFAPLAAAKEFHGYIDANLPKDRHCYLMIDEVQELEEWARAVNSVRASYNVDIYVTGSNSRLFAGEHLTYLSGRYIEIKIYPLSFVEYLQFTEQADRGDETTLNDYLRWGSFPAMALTDNNELREAILAGLLDSIVRRDIVLRGSIRNEAAFYKVLNYVCDNIGNQTSANAIDNTLASRGHKITTDTVDSYLTLMCNAHLLYQCQRYDIRGRERLRTNGKYYIVDNGLRNTLLGARASDFGHVLENMVFLELLRRGNEVNVGKTARGEVDFIASRGNLLAYYQVSQTLMDPATLERELAQLQAIPDNYPKFILSMDNVDFSAEGIQHHNIIAWLLSG
jgi:predicted AAA+ superfamily ATPase